MRELSIAYTPEPPPTGDGAIVLDRAVFAARHIHNDEWLAKALISRAEIGKAKYGDYLRTNNGRNAVVDYLQEQLDAIMYATQAFLEGDGDECSELLAMSIWAAQAAHNMIEKGSVSE